MDSYLQFSTEVSVDIISYRDSDNNIALNVLPAITVCNDHIFRELLFNNETHATELQNTFANAYYSEKYQQKSPDR